MSSVQKQTVGESRRSASDSLWAAHVSSVICLPAAVVRWPQNHKNVMTQYKNNFYLKVSQGSELLDALRGGGTGQECVKNEKCVSQTLWG